MAKIDKIPSDCEFPQLREILDPEKLTRAMQRCLRPSLSDSDARVEESSIERLYYRPRSDCRLRIKTRIRHGASSSADEQIHFGVLYYGRDAASVFEALPRERLAQPKFGEPVTLLPQWHMILWAYPNDPRLPGMAVLESSKVVLASARANPGAFGLTGAPVTISSRMAKYVPGKRCGSLYNLTVPDGSDAFTAFAVYGKAYAKGLGRQAFAKMKTIWECAAQSPHPFRIPEPYSYDEENDIFWQEALDGKPLAKTIGERDDLIDLAGEIGRGLAAFHGIEMELPEKMTLEFQIRELSETLVSLRESYPDIVSRSDAITAGLLDAAAGLERGPLTPVHASFKFSHIFATDSGIAFMDFDGANRGEPAYDLGRFLAHLYKIEAADKISPEMADGITRSFCSGYHAIASQPVSQDKINWFAASHLMSSQVNKAVKRMEPGRIDRLLRKAEQLLAEPSNGGASATAG